MSVLRPGLCASLTDEIVNALKDKGVCKTVDFVAKDVEDLSLQTGVSYKELMSSRRVILAEYGSPAVTGSDLYSSALSSVAILPTGCTSLDTILNGGLYTGEVTEVVGEVASGKTQVCFSTAATTARNSKNNVLYIDTCNNFSAQRIANIIGDTSMWERSLSCIQCISVFTIFELLDELDTIKDNMLNQSDPFHRNLKLLIVDNVASVVYPILGNSVVEGQGLLCQLGNKLKCLAVEFSLAVLTTNNTVGGEGGTRTAGLGRAWSHVPHTRLIIHPREDNSQQLEIELVKSSRLQIGNSAQFIITNTGLGTPG